MVRNVLQRIRAGIEVTVIEKKNNKWKITPIRTESPE